jgi:uncharacterized delta-60 repeat protein
LGTDRPSTLYNLEVGGPERSWILVAVLLLSCGRIGFEPGSGGLDGGLDSHALDDVAADAVTDAARDTLGTDADGDAGLPFGLDPSFGSAGTVTTRAGLANAHFTRVEEDESGRYVIAGNGTTAVGFDFVLRLREDGSLDTTFGGDGVVMPDSDGFATYDLAVDGSERITIFGWVPDGGREFRAHRWLENGSFDPAFGTGGVADSDIIGEAHAGVLLADGRLMMGGDRVAARRVWQLARLLEGGAVDATFGMGGVVQHPGVGLGDGTISAMALDSRGRIMACGSVDVTGTVTPQIVVARMNADGALDPTWGGGAAGGAIAQTHCEALAVVDDSTTVAVGWADNDGDNAWCVQRFVDGAVDPTFGYLQLDTFDGEDDRAKTVVMDASGRMIVAGSPGLHIARINPDATFDTSFAATLGTTDFFARLDPDPGSGFEDCIIDGASRIVCVGSRGDQGFIARILPPP